MTQNKILQEQMINMQNNNEEAIKEQNKILQDIIPKIGSNNNYINIQMFLNKECAQAMSIQNFANKLLITMDDLTKNKYECISNVVLKNLKPLSIKERPFHCTNFKNKEWFVKDDNQGWEEDNGEKLLKNTEAGIQKKWSNEFEKLYPQWINNEKLKEKYIEIAGNTSSKLLEKNKNILLNELANETLLKKLV